MLLRGLRGCLRCSQPPATSLGFSCRAKSTLTTIKPAADAPRQVPTPILFLAVKALTQQATKANDLYYPFIQHFASQGYESLLVDLDPEEIGSKKISKEILDVYERDMSSLLRTASPFPPILFTRDLSCLIAEQYASSHPLSSLLLLDPPISSSRAHEDHPTLFPTPFEEYDFEPRFPCKVMWSSAEMARHKEKAVPWYEVHRIEHAAEEEAGEALDRIVWADVDKEGPQEIQKWLEDECGVSSDATTQLPASQHTVDLKEHDEDFDEDDEEDLYDDRHQLSDTSSRSASRLVLSSGGRTGDGTLSGRFLLPDRSLPEWFTNSSKYSFTSIRKMPLTLDESHLRETFNRGGGKGGQAINKNKSRCDLLHLPTGTIVRCQEQRALERNRVLARRRMSVLLEEGLRAGQADQTGQGHRDKMAGMSVKEKAREKERKRKSNKKKKQKKKRGEIDEPEKEIKEEQGSSKQ